MLPIHIAWRHLIACVAALLFASSSSCWASDDPVVALETNVEAALQAGRGEQVVRRYQEEVLLYREEPVPFDEALARQGPLLRRARRPYDEVRVAAAKVLYLERLGYRAPACVYDGAPAYGLWDAGYLWATLARVDREPWTALFFWHHWGDRGMARWRARAEELARLDTTLASQIQRVAALRPVGSVKGIRPDPSYLPPDAPPEVVLAPRALALAAEEVPITRWEARGAEGAKRSWQPLLVVAVVCALATLVRSLRWPKDKF